MPEKREPQRAGVTLDPDDWNEIRAQGHRMLDGMFDFVEHVRERPVWQPIPNDVRARFHAALPNAPGNLEDIYREFADFIAPYSVGNLHPGFMGWVHGAEQLSACLRRCSPPV